jgi:hypothetical protein
MEMNSKGRYGRNPNWFQINLNRMKYSCMDALKIIKESMALLAGYTLFGIVDAKTTIQIE